MYKDGKVVSNDTWVKCGAHPCGDSKASNLNLFIAHGYAGKFRGILDEVAIIGAVLSEAEIHDIMTEGWTVLLMLPQVVKSLQLGQE